MEIQNKDNIDTIHITNDVYIYINLLFIIMCAVNMSIIKNKLLNE